MSNAFNQYPHYNNLELLVFEVLRTTISTFWHFNFLIKEDIDWFFFCCLLYCHCRLQGFEREVEMLREESARLRSQTERLRTDRTALQQRLGDTETSLNEAQEQLRSDKDTILKESLAPYHHRSYSFDLFSFILASISSVSFYLIDLEAFVSFISFLVEAEPIFHVEFIWYRPSISWFWCVLRSWVESW